MSSSVLEGLKPAGLWKHFGALSSIPRCSGNESQAAAYVIEQARSRGLEYVQDRTGNVVVRVPASPGLESVPPVILQGHLDMVGEKDSSSSHDFGKDPIQLARDGEYLVARGTTLGADNGIGLAAALSMMDEKTTHGALELLFTVDEERGLTGAQGLESGFVRGTRMLNLDSEEEGSLYVGCAGGSDTLITLPLLRKPGKGEVYLLNVHGLRGGHSGLDINLGRGNALKILGWTLDRMRREMDFGLIDLDGGDKHNAIPREARAKILVAGRKKAEVDRLVQSMKEELSACYGKTDPGLAIEVLPATAESAPLVKRIRDRFLDLLIALPHGVLAMSQAVDGLVESSTNLAVVKMEDETAIFHESSRSSVMPALTRIQESLFGAARLAGAEPEHKGGYPGWQPNLDSPLLGSARTVHERVTGQAPKVKAIHAGLECGIIGEKWKGMDMLSFGPQIEWPHSPSERVKVDSVERFYKYLIELLSHLANNR